LKEEALDRTLWKIRFGIGCGPVVRERRKGWRLLWLTCSSRHRSWHTTGSCARFDTSCGNKLHQQTLERFIKTLPKKDWHK